MRLGSEAPSIHLGGTKLMRQNSTTCAGYCSGHLGVMPVGAAGVNCLWLCTLKGYIVNSASTLNNALIAQLGERQTEDLKVPSSILG